MDLSLFEKYKEEINLDVNLDELSLKQTQTKLPSIRHKWVARLMQQKFEMTKLNSLKKEALGRLVEKIKEEEPVVLSDMALKRKAEQHEIILKINDEIEVCKLIIEFLDKEIDITLKPVSFDIKNLIEVIKLETT